MTAPDRFESALVGILRVLVGCLMLAAVTVNFANVVGRYVFLRPFVWGEEVMQFMNVWAVMLGAAVVTSHGTHLRMDAFYNLAPSAVRRLLDALINVLAVAVSLYVIFQSLQMIGMLSATGQRSVIARVPMNAMYAAIPLGFGSGVLLLVLWFYRFLRGGEGPRRREAPPAA